MQRVGGWFVRGDKQEREKKVKEKEEREEAVGGCHVD
jgi:hypothetical protein